MADVILKCVECGKSFTWSDKDQKKYKEKGFTQPKRCRACRTRRRQEKEDREAETHTGGDKEWGNCESCGQFQPLTEVGMCGPCTFGDAETINGNW